MHKKFFSFLAGSTFLVILDQIVKAWARSAADGVEGRVFAPWWPGVFELKLVFNEGVAFGMLKGNGLLMTPVAVAISVYAVWASWRKRDEHTAFHVLHGLLLAGAVGNMIDRVVHKRVTDMFWIRLIDFPVFNVADVCITGAGALIVWGAIAELVPKRTSAMPEEAGPVPETVCEPSE